MNRDLFIRNRKKILDQMENDSIFLIFNREKEESIVNQRYDLDRNYFYATGILEFGDILVLCKLNNKETEFIYSHPYDAFRAKWHGANFSKEEITEISGIKDVRYLELYNDHLNRLLGSVKTVYLDMPTTELSTLPTENEALASKILAKKPWLNIKNGREFFVKARMVKEPEELAEMRKAIEITNKGIQAILSNIRPMYEYQLESYFDQAIKFNGANGYAFPTIAASGKNSTCLHYSYNNCMAKDGDLILFDLGASCNMYCADISRTFPINGKFTERQKQIYNIVLSCQQHVFENARPGLTTRDLNRLVVEFYERELTKIGLIKEPAEVSKYYYHGVSHHIGLECHDLSDTSPLKPGCVISNEPGLYIAEEGIGIRIEDDVLITDNGAEWLSPQIIKTVDDIEAFIAKNRK